LLSNQICKNEKSELKTSGGRPFVCGSGKHNQCSTNMKYWRDRYSVWRFVSYRTKSIRILRRIRIELGYFYQFKLWLLYCVCLRLDGIREKSDSRDLAHIRYLINA
jgi:hypothetical protein